MKNLGRGSRTTDASKHVATLMKSLEGKQEAHDWLRVDERGVLESIPADKHGIVEQLDIPYRDLRMVDPLVPIPYPTAIFIRDRALVVNLENIRMIICHDQAFVLAVPGPDGLDDWEPPTPSNWLVQELVEQLEDPDVSMHDLPFVRSSYKVRHDQAQPYEMRVLECALWGCHQQLQKEIDTLDGPAGSVDPAVRALILRVDRGNLERVRDIKGVVTRFIDRVGAVKKELEDILDDDEDMSDMYLERRAEQLATKAAMKAGSVRSGDAALSDRAAGGGEERRVSPHDIEEAENLIESYFMQMNLLLSRLLLVKEKIDDTEDLINIELDHRRNELVAFNLVVTILAASLGFVAAIAGIFGMNLAPLPIETTDVGFYAATFGSIGISTLLLVGMLGYAAWQRILFIPQGL